VSVGFVRLVLVEARHNPGLWLCPFLALTVGYLAHRALMRGIWLWPDTGLSILSTLLVIGPLVGGLSAWQAGRNWRRGTEELLAATPRPAPVRDLAAWSATVVWHLLAYAVAAGSILVLAYLGDAGGPFTLWPVVVGLMAIVACSSVGYAAGHYLPRGFTAPSVAAVLFLALQFLSREPSSAIHLAPLGASLTRSAFFGILPNVFPEQAIWLAGLSGAGLGAVVIGRRRTAPAIGFFALSLALAALGAALLLREPPWADSRQTEAGIRPYDPVCATEEIPVCVHPAYAKWLPEAAEVVSAISGPFAGIPGGPTRAEQVHTSVVGLEPDGTLQFFLHDASSLEYWLALDTARVLVGDDGSTSAASSDSARLAIEAWLLRRAGGDPEDAINLSETPERTAAASECFARLPPEERRTWLRAHYADLREGRVTLEDLP